MDPDRPAYKWWIALSVIPGGLIHAVEATSVGIAIPNMMTNLRADLDQIQWVVTVSLITQTLVMPTVGWLIELFGQRNFFVIGLGTFVVGSVLCSLAWSLESLICFRAIQGLGSGTLVPVSMAILYSAFPPQQRGTAMGLFNLSVALGLIIGRCGGFLVDAFNWRMIFYLPIPFSVLSAILGFFIIPSTEQQRRWSIDTWGLLTMVGFIIPLLLALTQGRFEGWDSPYIRVMFALSGISFIGFIAIELHSKAPVVDLRLYTNFTFAVGWLVQFMVTIMFMGSTFLINIFLQRVHQFTPSQVGVLMFPESVVYGLSSIWAGRLSDYLNPRLPLVLGLLCFALVYYWLGGISVFATATVIASMMCLRAFSYACVNSPNALLSLQALPEDQVGMGSGLFSVARGIAGTFGVAMSATFLEHRRTVHAVQFAQQQGVLEMPSQWTLTGLQRTFEGLGDVVSLARVKAAAHLHKMMLEEATITAYQDFFLLSAGLSLLIILPALLRKRASLSSSDTKETSVTVEERTSRA
jgi:DHA2 family multidrug resistance protein